MFTVREARFQMLNKKPEKCVSFVVKSREDYRI